MSKWNKEVFIKTVKSNCVAHTSSVIVELINFSDADGVIGPIASQKLYNDFVKYEEPIMKKLDRFYLKFEEYEIDG